MNNPWYVYIVECSDKTLYTGISTNPEKRALQHSTGKGSKSIVKSKRPVKLVFIEKHPDKSSAAKREYAIKKWKREYKLKLINKQKE